MDEIETIMEHMKQESAAASQGLAKMVLDMYKNTKTGMEKATAAAKRMTWIAGIASALAVLCMASCVYLSSMVNKQAAEISSLRGEIASVQRILDQGVVIEETTTTTEETTTVTQDTGEGSGNNVFQAGENSQYTQNGGG